jgi:hypothetical protein
MPPNFKAGCNQGGISSGTISGSGEIKFTDQIEEDGLRFLNRDDGGQILDSL